MNPNENKRWQEIRFYYMCLHIYQMRHDLMDLMYAIETISQMGDIKLQRIKALAGNLISEIGNTPHKEEILYLAYKAKVSPKLLKSFFGFSYRQMNYQANSCNEPPHFVHRLSETDNKEICNFMNIVDQFKGGIL
jgi:hypothetical protein